MSIATRLSALLSGSRYQRRPRVTANRRARAVLSRDRRWKRRGGGSMLGKVLLALVGGAAAAAAWAFIQYDATPKAPPLAFPEFVAEAEAAFPEALAGHTRARGGTMADGREVPVALTLLLPAHALKAAGAAPDALTRLSAPFVGAEPAISGPEIGARIARLAQDALPEGVARCYTYTAAPPRRIVVSNNRTLHVTPLDIAFNPGCENTRVTLPTTGA